MTLPKNPFLKHGLSGRVKLVAEITQDIYAIWQRDYGMKNRHRGQSTAIDIAIVYSKLFGWKVSIRP